MSAAAGSHAAAASEEDGEEARERKIAQLDAMWSRMPIMVSSVDKRIHKLSKQPRKQQDVDARARSGSGSSSAVASTAVPESQSVAESQSDGPALGDVRSVPSGASEAESCQEAQDDSEVEGSDAEGIRTPSSDDLQDLDKAQSYSAVGADACFQSQAVPSPLYFQEGVYWTSWMPAAPQMMQQNVFASERLLGNWMAADGSAISVNVDAASNRLVARHGQSWCIALEVPTGGCDWRCGDAVFDSARSNEWQLVWRMPDGSDWVWWAAQQVSSSQMPCYVASMPSSCSGAGAAARPHNATAASAQARQELDERPIHPSMFIFGSGYGGSQSTSKTKTGRRQKKPGGNENLFDASDFPALAGPAAGSDRQRQSSLGSGEEKAEKPGTRVDDT